MIINLTVPHNLTQPSFTHPQVVINFTMPHNLTQYIHRVGRTARAGKKGTAVTLVGEAERKLLKEIVKNAKEVPKSRVVPPGIIERYREKIESMASDIKSIVQQEKEERMVCVGLQVLDVARKKERMVCTFSFASVRPDVAEGENGVEEFGGEMFGYH